jgi:hypothetical protein
MASWRISWMAEFQARAATKLKAAVIRLTMVASTIVVAACACARAASCA